MTQRAGDKFKTYSLGMKQRIGVAAALLKDPELLILDEPTNGLGPQGMADMRALIRRLGILAGKVAVLALVLLALTLALFLVGAACSALIITLEGASSTWPPPSELLPAIGAGWLILDLWCAFGVFLGVLTRGTSLAIGVGLIYLLVIEALLGGILGQLDAVRTIQQFLPGANATALINSFGTTIAEQTAQESIAGPARAASVVALYLIGFLILSWSLFRRRDLG